MGLRLGFFLIFCLILTSCGFISASKTSGREVFLDHKKLEEVPIELYYDSSITKISLFGNHITSINQEIRNLQQLEVLYLGKNDFTTFPKEICALKNLKVLSFQHNQIDTIPDCIGQMTSLERINFSTNKLVYISDSLSKLMHLEQLDLSRNKLRFLPKNSEMISTLQWVDLSYNDLEKLPDSLQFLTDLRELNLYYAGALLQVPESLCHLRYLEKIKADPSIVFPMCVLTQRTNRLIIYVEP